MTREPRTRLAVGVGVLISAAVVGGQLGRAWWSEFRLPERLRSEELVADLSATFPTSALDPDPSLTVGWLQPGEELRAEAAARRAIVTPPGSAVRFRVRVPPDGVLGVGMAVAGEGRRDPGAAGIRFTVTADGHELLARTINPAATRHDRVWIDARVPLAGPPAQTIDVVLATATDGPGRPAGTAGWSRVRVLREVLHERQPARRDAPNVLLLLVDTLRADRLGCYGARPSPSPTLDRLAGEGLFFPDAVSQAPWTAPAVASILTGLQPRSHGVVGRVADAMAAGDENDPTFLPDGCRTLAEAAADTGITTVGVSTNPLVSRGSNFARGFETFVEFGSELRDGGKNWASAAEVNTIFLRWLGRNRSRRFFAYLHYMEPHHPYTPPERLRPPPPPDIRKEIVEGRLSRWSDQILSPAGFLLPAPEVDYLLRLYDAEIRGWDDELGRLTDGLDRLGVRDSTVIIVTADHGEEFQEHGRLQHGMHLYDELIRVPLLVVGPGIPRERAPEQAQGIDIFPTVAALLGVSTPPGLPGQNLLGPRAARPAVSETNRGRLPDGTGVELLSLRTPQWKLIWAPAVDRYTLFDLVHDPAERADRAATAPERAELAARLAHWRTTAPAPLPSDSRDPAAAEKLRALGYVQ